MADSAEFCMKKRQPIRRDFPVNAVLKLLSVVLEAAKLFFNSLQRRQILLYEDTSNVYAPSHVYQTHFQLLQIVQQSC
jgi:hypothetical protein